MKLFHLANAVLCVMVLAGCEGDATPFEEAVEVRTKNLVSLNVVPPRMSVAKMYLNHGQVVQFGVQARNARGETVELRASDREWGISKPGLASIDANGKLVALADGEVSVVIRIGGLQSSPFVLTVQHSPLQAMEEIKGNDIIERCLPADYQATVRHVDQTVRDLYNTAWSLDPTDSGNARVLTNDDGTATVTGVNSSVVQLSTATANLPAISRPLEIANTLVGLAISPSVSSVSVGSTLDYSAIGTYTLETQVPELAEPAATEDGEPAEPDTGDTTGDTTDDTTGATTATSRRVDISDSVSWSVADSGVATIVNGGENSGRLTGVTAGSTVITASCGDDPAQQLVTVSDSSTSPDSTDALSFNEASPLVLRPSESVLLRVSTGASFNSANALNNDNLLWTFRNSGATSNAIVLETEGIDAGRVRAVVASGEGTVTATQPGGGSVSIVIRVAIN